MLHGVDLFCGAGGTSSGAEATGGVKIRYALNHWDIAIQTHAANFSECHHFKARLDQIHPREVSRVDILFASPECTHHSNARGGKPMDDQSRCQAHDVLKWVEFHRPTWVVIENVREFQNWGPLGRDGRPLKSLKGKLFDSWLMMLRSTGYRVDFRLLNAADFGAATSRTRLFIIARKGNYRIQWPEPTHLENPPKNALPGMGLPRWKSAAEIIDWSITCPSIFNRKRPLQEKTLKRIEMGLRKFVGPYVVQWDQHGNNGSCSNTISEPIGTIVTKSNRGVAMPFLMHTQGPGLNDPSFTGIRDFSRPIPTIMTANNHGVVMPYLVGVNHGDRDGVASDRSYSIQLPVQTLTSKRSLSVAVPFLAHYYGTHNSSPVDSPVDTITTKDRHALAVALYGEATLSYAGDDDTTRSIKATMRELGVADIGFRMLSNEELSRAQGFEDAFIFAGNKSQVTRQIGNSVSPSVAQSITQAILSV